MAHTAVVGTGIVMSPPKAPSLAPVAVEALREVARGRTGAHTNADAKTAVSKAMRDSRPCRTVLAETDDAREVTWRERALNAEDALKAAHAEIVTQRSRIGELLGRILDLEAEWNQDAVQRVTTQNATLKQRVRQLTTYRIRRTPLPCRTEVQRWRSAARLAALATAWHDNPPGEIAEPMWAWYRADWKLWHHQEHGRRRALEHRDDCTAGSRRCWRPGAGWSSSTTRTSPHSPCAELTVTRNRGIAASAETRGLHGDGSGAVVSVMAQRGRAACRLTPIWASRAPNRGSGYHHHGGARLSTPAHAAAARPGLDRNAVALCSRHDRLAQSARGCVVAPAVDLRSRPQAWGCSAPAWVNCLRRQLRRVTQVRRRRV